MNTVARFRHREKADKSGSERITADTSFTRFSPCQGEDLSKVRIGHKPTATSFFRNFARLDEQEPRCQMMGAS